MFPRETTQIKDYKNKVFTFSKMIRMRSQTNSVNTYHEIENVNHQTEEGVVCWYES